MNNVYLLYKTDNCRNADNGFGGNFHFANMSPFALLNEKTNVQIAYSETRQRIIMIHEHSMAKLFVVYPKENGHHRRPPTIFTEFTASLSF